MKVGIVGYGSIGKRHADNAQVLGHEIVVYDPLVRRDVKFERMIYEQCDVVVVATPSPAHEGPLRAAIEHRRHVLMEKPISTSVGMLPILLGDATEKNLVVMMGNNLRFHPCVQQAKEWIDDGKIGTPVWAHFICGQESTKPLYLSDGVILNTGAHEVDMALHLLGPAKVAYANSCTKLRAGTADSDVNVFFTEDIADFMLVHDNGCRSTFHLDFITPNQIREAWVVGSEEKIGIELRNRTCSLGGEARARPGNFDGDYFSEMTAFFDRIKGETTPGATGWDGLATLRVLLDVRKMAGLV
jgi:UDP-N-acetylglucosamine 3-dehydrogenase